MHEVTLSEMLGIVLCVGLCICLLGLYIYVISRIIQDAT